MKLTTASTTITAKAGEDVTIRVSVDGETGGKEVRYHFKENPQANDQPPSVWDQWKTENSVTLKAEKKNVRVWGATEESGAPKPFDESLTISIVAEEAPDPRLGTSERIYDPAYAHQMRRWILIPAWVLSGILVAAGIIALFVFGGISEFERAAGPLFSGLGIVVLVAVGAMIAGGGIYLMAVEHRATLPKTPPGPIEAAEVSSSPVDPESLKEFRKMPAPWAVMLVAAVALISAAWVGGRLASNEPSPTPTPTPTSTISEPSPSPATESPSP